MRTLLRRGYTEGSCFTENQVPMITLQNLILREATLGEYRDSAQITCWGLDGYFSDSFVTLGPFLRNATDVDFPRLVRSVRSQRLAATDVIYSKAVNWVRFLPTLLMFQTEKTKTDLEHMLDLTHIVVLPCQQSGILTVYMFAPCHHWPNMSKTQPLDLDKRSSWGENSSKNLYLQMVYYERSNSFRRANFLYRLSQSFLLRGRRSKPGISIEICQNSLSERP